MFKCPYCSKETVSIWDKLKLIVLDKSQCKACGEKMAVPRSTMVLNYVFLFVLIFPDMARNYMRVIPFTNVFVWIATLILFFIVNIYAYPIIKKEAK